MFRKFEILVIGHSILNTVTSLLLKMQSDSTEPIYEDSERDLESIKEEEEESPLGTWKDLSPSKSRQIRALYKKAFLTKIRSVSSIIEILIAFILPFLMYMIYVISKSDIEAVRYPEVEEVPLVSNDLMAFFMMTENPTFLVAPDNDKMKNLINHTLLLQQLPSMNIELQYMKDASDFEEKIYSTNSNGIGIHWVNHEDEDSFKNPIFEIYYQTLYFLPSTWTFMDLKHALAMINYEKTGNTTKIQNSPLLMNNIKYTKQGFAHPKLTFRSTGASFALGFFVTLPLIFMTMTDMDTIISEKSVHITPLSFLMGMSEFSYWLVSFTVPFFIGLVIYVFHSFMLCYAYAMKGTSVIFIIVTQILYLIGEILFQFTISTFIINSGKGRMMMIILIVANVFLMLIINNLVIVEDSTTILAHILAIIPSGAHIEIMMQAYVSSVTTIAPLSFKRLSDPSYYCQPWIPFMWQIIDCFLYFGLFLLFNTFNPRGFGTSIMRWRDIFDKEAWKKAFSSQTEKRIGNENGKFLAVNGLKKVYHGTKDITALKGIDFDIKRGEVIVMIGPNGAGKSTLINTIAGAIEPSDGIVNILGHKTNRFKDIQKFLGVCFQDNVIINHLSVREHFDYFGAIRGVKPEILEDTIEYFATNMQLTEMLNNRAGDLSGVQKRKLCIGLSLLGNPPLVLMDEPTAGVDVQARQLIWKMISKMKHTTSIVTSHALEEAEAVSSRLFIVAGGKIPFAGTSTELRNDCNCGYQLKVEMKSGYDFAPILEFTKSFIPSANLSEESKNTISLPVDKSIPKFLAEFTRKEDELGVISYSFTVEQLEDMLLKLIQKEEVNNE
ncbi:ABC transporter family protein [Tritrichomonas foetus]|uniref:ABC transporter family protein n=1 Tax=Tritrichomonas foetus TaxID=1144522 RepID=A0A1J4K906_9EUKA|nr:ABC transporter family protein [Tritrichomonas foetus]|eukprot:OHT07699.1 ABC transporter family protein [Tritrichomonas foetus]